jgi:hypothetical protein
LHSRISTRAPKILEDTKIYVIGTSFIEVAPPSKAVFKLVPVSSEQSFRETSFGELKTLGRLL